MKSMAIACILKPVLEFLDCHEAVIAFLECQYVEAASEQIGDLNDWGLD